MIPPEAEQAEVTNEFDLANHLKQAGESADAGVVALMQEEIKTLKELLSRKGEEKMHMMNMQA